MRQNDHPTGISPLSEQCRQVQPGQMTACSQHLGWTALLTRTFESATTVEEFETRETPDQLIVVVLRGECVVESRDSGLWKKAMYRPGVGGLTAGLTTNRLRWHAKNRGMFETQHIFLAHQLMLEIRDEYGRCGTPIKSGNPNTLLFEDPLLYQVAASVQRAVNFGAPELYAETVAQYLALHLLSMNSNWKPEDDRRQSGPLPDRRLTRVLEYMEQHCSEPLTLDQLAREAGISRFHFVRLFRERIGVTPHSHLIYLRMARAEAMLREEDSSIGEVAGACGYANMAHFATNFRKHFAVSPRDYRLSVNRKNGQKPSRVDFLRRPYQV